MPDAFDPYFKWLGIPKADQPPHAYRLLGIELFESDADVISNAADGRMAQIKSFQTGKYGAISQKLLNEVAAAKLCLLKPEKKAEYDRRLQSRLQPKRPSSNVDVAEAVAADEVAPTEDVAAELSFLDYAATRKRKKFRRNAKRGSLAWLVPVAVAVMALAAAGGIYVYYSTTDAGKDTPPSRQAASLGDGNRGGQPAPSAGSSAKLSASGSNANPKPTAGGMRPGKDSGQGSLTSPPPPTAKTTSGLAPASEEQGEPDESPPLNETPANVAEKTPAKSTAASPQPEKAATVTRPPTPDPAEYQAKKNEIFKVFQKENADARTADAKLALAAKFDKGGDVSNDPVERYAFWRSAADKAADAGEFAMAVVIADKIESHFDGDATSIKAELLSNGASHAGLTPEAARGLCEVAMKLAAAAATGEDFDAAAKFAKAANAATRRMKDAQFTREVTARKNEIDRFKARYEPVAKANVTLRSDPDNAAANLVVGQWECFVRDDWDKGPSFLVKGSREDLAAVARLELARPANGQDQVALGDAWWALAEKDRSDYKAAYQARTLYWFEQALPKLTGLEKARVEKLVDSGKSRLALESRGRVVLPRGLQQQGNVAASHNGATVEGPTEDRDCMLGDTIQTGRASQAKGPCEFTVTLDKVYLLQQIRILFYAEYAYPYAVLVSRDGRRFDLLEDHTREKLKGWQELRFSPRPVKAIKFVCPLPGNLVEIAKFEAYCYPIAADGAPLGRNGG